MVKSESMWILIPSSHLARETHRDEKTPTHAHGADSKIHRPSQLSYGTEGKSQSGRDKQANMETQQTRRSNRVAPASLIKSDFCPVNFVLSPK